MLYTCNAGSVSGVFKGTQDKTDSAFRATAAGDGHKTEYDRP